MLRFFISVYFLWAVLGMSLPRLDAGEAYYTGFENFVAGDDKIVGTESWTGTYNGSRLHGVLSEAQHGVIGIGNAAIIGGFGNALTRTSSGNSVYVRRQLGLDPVALNQEVVTFSIVFGIKDSTTMLRDNFEFLIYNQSNALLGGIQMDNTTLDLATGKPRRLIYRLGWNSATNTFQYFLTSFNFLPETMETLTFRINFKTNLWTVSLSDLAIFQDLAFYTGTATKNLGSAMVKMAVKTTTSTTISPGDNYMLFDDYRVSTDALDTGLALTKTSTGAANLVWNQEAAYRYQLEYSDDFSLWKTDLPGSYRAATLTQSTTFNDPTIIIPQKRFYRIKRTYP